MGPSFNEKSFGVAPDIMATKIGLSNALFLTKLHALIRKTEHIYDGKRWVFNTYEGWRKYFPYWSARTIQSVISELEKGGFIESGNFNKMKFDRTKWYTVNYEKIKEMYEEDA